MRVAMPPSTLGQSPPLRLMWGRLWQNTGVVRNAIKTTMRPTTAALHTISSISSASSSPLVRRLPSTASTMKQLYFCKRTIFHNSDALEFLPMDTETKWINAGRPDALEVIRYYPTIEIAQGHSFEPPSVILLHEAWGLTAHIKHLAQDIANQGFNVITPDLFRGRRTTDAKQAEQWAAEVDYEAAMKDIEQCVDMLRSDEVGRYRSKVGVMGLGLGGEIALLATVKMWRKIDSGVSLYGLPPLDLFLNYNEAMRKERGESLPLPFMILIGEDDKVTGVTSTTASYNEYFEAGRSTEMHATLALAAKQTHGFMNFSISNKRRKELGMSPYEHEAACQAFQLTSSFLLGTLSEDL